MRPKYLESFCEKEHTHNPGIQLSNNHHIKSSIPCAAEQFKGMIKFSVPDYQIDSTSSNDNEHAFDYHFGINNTQKISTAFFVQLRKDLCNELSACLNDLSVICK